MRERRGAARGSLVIRQRRGKASGRTGQSLAEFALVFPVLFLIIAGIIQFGIIFWGQNTLNQIVRDTGRWAASQLTCVNNDQQVIDTASSIAASSSMIGYASGSWTASNVTVTYTPVSPCPPNSNQQVAWVNITISAKVPIFFPLVPGNGQLSSSTQFRMEPVPK